MCMAGLFTLSFRHFTLLLVSQAHLFSNSDRTSGPHCMHNDFLLVLLFLSPLSPPSLCTTGLQHQGIFRVSGSQVEVNDIKNSFERGGWCNVVTASGFWYINDINEEWLLCKRSDSYLLCLSCWVYNMSEGYVNIPLISVYLWQLFMREKCLWLFLRCQPFCLRLYEYEIASSLGIIKAWFLYLWYSIHV